jgi:hypothetical protein
MSFNEFATHRASARAYDARKPNASLPMASVCRRATDERAVPPLDIGVRAVQP